MDTKSYESESKTIKKKYLSIVYFVFPVLSLFPLTIPMVHYQVVMLTI